MIILELCKKLAHQYTIFAAEIEKQACLTIKNV